MRTRRSTTSLVAGVIVALALGPAACGGGDDDAGSATAQDAGTRPASVEAGSGSDESASPVLGRYTLTLGPKAARRYDEQKGKHELELEAGVYRSMTPLGPGISGPASVSGSRYTFEPDFRRECADAFEYELRVEDGRLRADGGANDPCELRRRVLELPWRKE